MIKVIRFKKHGRRLM